MEYFIISLISLVASALTLFSGFGLGTILMPVFAIFFPIETSVALTAIVHFLNNLFKLALLGKYADKKVVLKFGATAILGSFAGAQILLKLSGLLPLFNYQFSTHNFKIMPVKLVVAILMIFFALFELMPKFENMAFDKKHLPFGGLLSGFFGGLSGHQGALRSAFLIKCGLNKESFIGTGVVIACLVDISRLSVYGGHFSSAGISKNGYLLLMAVVSAFLGAFIGNRLVKKVKLRTVQIVVSVMLLGIALCLGAGVI